VLNVVMAEQGIDTVQLWSDIDSALVKTVVPAAGMLKHHYHLSFPRHPQACFILLGVDVLLDADLKPYIIEVKWINKLTYVSVQIKR
jgi:tubulin polyglutamylase TTLL6/13